MFKLAVNNISAGQLKSLHGVRVRWRWRDVLSSEENRKVQVSDVILSTRLTAACSSPAMYGVRLKKLTEHLKCDNSVTLENFCAKFCVLSRVLFTSVLLLSEITLHIQNWHDVKL